MGTINSRYPSDRAGEKTTPISAAANAHALAAAGRPARRRTMSSGNGDTTRNGTSSGSFRAMP
jgi:hypothetical protein